MALDEYRRKRDFTRTPEPSGREAGAPAPGGGLWDRLPEGSRFCVQMHRATRLHYDFRLEHGGVLLSWAIPRGPSLDPSSRRLAVQTEDHPIDYGDFEGVIPSGYGMGTVELWDAGSFEWARESLVDPDAQLRKGDIKFRLRGQKLAGEFALVRIGERGRRRGPARSPSATSCSSRSGTMRPSPDTTPQPRTARSRAAAPSMRSPPPGAATPAGPGARGPAPRPPPRRRRRRRGWPHPPRRCSRSPRIAPSPARAGSTS